MYACSLHMYGIGLFTKTLQVHCILHLVPLPVTYILYKLLQYPEKHSDTAKIKTTTDQSNLTPETLVCQPPTASLGSSYRTPHRIGYRRCTTFTGNTVNFTMHQVVLALKAAHSNKHLHYRNKIWSIVRHRVSGTI